MHSSTAHSGEPSDAILDAGGETSAVLDRALYRVMDDMRTGRVMDVISRDEETATEIRRWREATGHQLVDTESQGIQTVFWIRKNGHIRV